MVALIYIPGEFQVLSASTVRPGIAGEALTAGAAIYRNVGDRQWYNAVNATVAQATNIYLAGHSAALGGTILPVFAGTVLFGPSSSGTVGQLYVLSSTAGQLWQESDLLAGQYVTFAGIKLANGLFGFRPYSSGEQRA